MNGLGIIFILAVQHLCNYGKTPNIPVFQISYLAPNVFSRMTLQRHSASGTELKSVVEPPWMGAQEAGYLVRLSLSRGLPEGR